MKFTQIQPERGYQSRSRVMPRSALAEFLHDLVQVARYWPAVFV